jgi:hypothetical protein
MSKKIRIPLNNIKSSLSDLFHDFMSRRRIKKSSRGNYYDWYDDDDLSQEELMWLMANGHCYYPSDDDDYDYGSYYDNDDYDYDADDYDVIWPPNTNDGGKKHKKKEDVDPYANYWDKLERKNRKHKKHKHKKCSSRARIIDINTPYDGEEDDDISDNGITDGKEIYYYPNYHEKDSRLEFNSLKDFSDFCDDNGYIVNDDVSNLIMFNRVVHTCLKPNTREYGIYEMMADTSYGGMFYEVCEASELEG